MGSCQGNRLITSPILWKEKMNPIEIKPIKTDAARQATRLLAKSFLDNPVSVHVFDNFAPEKREKKLYTLYSGFVNTAIDYGVANGIFLNDELAGISLAYPPGSYPFSLWTWLLNPSSTAVFQICSKFKYL